MNRLIFVPSPLSALRSTSTDDRTVLTPIHVSNWRIEQSFLVTGSTCWRASTSTSAGLSAIMSFQLPSEGLGGRRSHTEREAQRDIGEQSGITDQARADGREGSESSGREDGLMPRDTSSMLRRLPQDPDLAK